LKQYLFKENGTIYFLFSYNDFSSLEKIMKVYLKEIDQLSKEEDFHKKLNYVLLVNIDLNKTTKTLIKTARSQLEQLIIFKDKICIEYNTKLHINIKKIFEPEFRPIEEHQYKKSVFPKLFSSKKKSNINFIYISDNLLKKKGDMKKEELAKISDPNLEDTQIDDPTENDLITSLTAGLTDLTDDVTSETDPTEEFDLDTMRSEFKGPMDQDEVSRSPENSELA
jgi:hypothetical protein